MKSVKNFEQLSEISLEDAQKLIGEMPGRLMHSFFRNSFKTIE